MMMMMMTFKAHWLFCVCLRIQPRYQ